MKKIFGLVVAILIASISMNAFAEGKGKASIKFEETLFDFGNVKENGGPVSHEFKFVNTGDGELVINSAKAECGCTRPEFTDKAIAPGENGSIKVTYNPAGRPGGFTKVITVRCNGTPSKVNLKIRGTVIPSK